MKARPPKFAILVLGLLAFHHAPVGAEETADEDSVIAWVQQRTEKIVRDEKHPDRPVVEVYFRGPYGPNPNFGDEGLGKLTGRLSYDEGKSWTVERVLDPGPAGNLNAIGLPDGRVGVLYEGGARQNFRETIYFSTCTVDWLTNGRDRGESLNGKR